MTRTWLGVVLALVGAVGCDGGDAADAGLDAGLDGGRDAGREIPDTGPVEDVTWPAMGSLSAASGRDGFRFGAASAATQIEDQNEDVDWYVWSQREPEGLGRGADPIGDAVRGFSLANEDVALMEEMSLDAYRFSVEWARVEPQRDVVSEEALAHGRWHTMLTSAFSHFDLTHLGMNMIALYFFGRSVCERFGGRYLLTLYCVGGVGASAAHVAWCARQRRKRMERYKEGRGNFFDRLDAYVARFVEDSGAKRGYYFTPAALGASGAVNAIVAFEVLLYPLRTIYLYAIVPVPSILLGGLFLMRDIVGIQDSRGSGVAHAGHLGGAAVGALALAMLRTGGRRGRISM